MKISGAELAAQRTAQRKHRELYNYGDLIAYRATKFANIKSQDQPLPINRAYHASCLVDTNGRLSALQYEQSSPPGGSTLTKAGSLVHSSQSQSWFFVNFGGTSDRKLSLAADIAVLDHSDDDDDEGSGDRELNDLSAIDPQFTTGTAETWQLSVNKDQTHSLDLVNDFTLPIALVGHSMIPYRAKNKLIIYGGAQLANRSLFSNIYVVSMKTFEVKQFRVKKGAQPAGRLRHSACLLQDRMYIYGGQSHSSAAICLEDFWCLDLLKSEWEQITPVRVLSSGSSRCIETQIDYDRSHGPGKRFGQHMVAYKGVIYMAFGSDGSSVLGDVWGFQSGYWFRVQLLNHLGDPYGNLQGRVDCAAALNEETGVWLFQGGIGADGDMLNTILEISLETFECRRIRAEVFDDESGVGSLLTGCSVNSHFTNPKTSLSSSNGSGGRILPAIRGHVMIHIPRSNTYILTRGISRYNDFTQTEYILSFTDLSHLKLKPPGGAPISEPIKFDQHYEVTPIFDTTHYWQPKHMPDQPPTLLQDDLRAVDAVGEILSQTPPERTSREETPEEGAQLSDREFSPMLIPQRLSAPRKHSGGDEVVCQQVENVSMRSASASSSVEKDGESETRSSSPLMQPRMSKLYYNIRVACSPGDHERIDADGITDRKRYNCKCRSLVYWRERCLIVERENSRLRTQVEKLVSNLNEQQNIITDVAHLLSRFSFVDIDQ